MVLAEVFPYPYFAQAYEGGMALLEKRDPVCAIPYQDRFLEARAGVRRRGVTRHDPASGRNPGLTLYSSGHEAAAYLIDMEGRVVHEWRLPFSAVWDESRDGAKPAARFPHLLAQGAYVPQWRFAGHL